MAEKPNLTSSFHTSSWYKNHPNVPRPEPPPISKDQTAPPKPVLLHRLLGLSTLGGFGLMRVYFWPGVAVVYFGFAALIWEICVEPELVKRESSRSQLIALAIVFALLDLFTIGIVAASAPIKFYSYAMEKGDYASGTTIGGISWDSHFTDLRIAITNLSNEDYQDSDIELQPDTWTY
jgi:hypothetical protein